VVPLDPEKGIVGHFPPHVLFYAPYLTNADLGSQNLACRPSSPAPARPTL